MPKLRLGLERCRLFLGEVGQFDLESSPPINTIILRVIILTSQNSFIHALTIHLTHHMQNVTESEETYWCLIMHSSACVDKLVSSIKTPWEVSFQTDLPIIHK